MCQQTDRQSHVGLGFAICKLWQWYRIAFAVVSLVVSLNGKWWKQEMRRQCKNQKFPVNADKWVCAMVSHPWHLPNELMVGAHRRSSMHCNEKWGCGAVDGGWLVGWLSRPVVMLCQFRFDLIGSLSITTAYKRCFIVGVTRIDIVLDFSVAPVFVSVPVPESADCLLSFCGFRFTTTTPHGRCHHISLVQRGWWKW